MDQESHIDWGRPASKSRVTREVNAFLRENVSLTHPRDGHPRILGFPVGEPDPFGVEIHGNALRKNPNNIGIHTTGEESEEGFRGSQEAERLLITMLADILGADLNIVDGYVESGGTIANMAGLCIGRNRTHRCDGKHRPIKSARNPTAVLCSHLTHYSITQNASNLGIGERTKIGEGDGTGVHILGTDENGHLLLSQLEERLSGLLRTHRKVSNIIVVGNAGTTMLGSVDDISGMSKMIGYFKERYPHKIFHFHVDAAHGGMLAPFLSHVPPIGFSNEHVDTVTIDPHKMGKVNFGCGAILARKGYFDWIESQCPYVPGGSKTISGSRPGAIVLGAYASLRYRGKNGLAEYAQTLRDLTWDIRSRLTKLGIELFGSDLNVIAAKTQLPEQMKKQVIVHRDERLPVDMSNPDSKLRRPIWNIVAMEHVEKHMKFFERQYRKCLDQQGS